LSLSPPRPNSFRLFALFWTPVLLYLVVIFALSAQPHLKAPLPFENGDKICHMAEYGGLGILIARALRASFRLRPLVVASLIVVLIGAVVGASDETFQRFVPGRDSSVYDWLADVTGLIFGQIVYLLFAHD